MISFLDCLKLKVSLVLPFCLLRAEVSLPYWMLCVMIQVPGHQEDQPVLRSGSTFLHFPRFILCRGKPRVCDVGCAAAWDFSDARYLIVARFSLLCHRRERLVFSTSPGCSTCPDSALTFYNCSKLLRNKWRDFQLFLKLNLVMKFIDFWLEHPSRISKRCSFS